MRKILGRLQEKGLLIISLAAHSLILPLSFFSFSLCGLKRVYRKSLAQMQVKWGDGWVGLRRGGFLSLTYSGSFETIESRSRSCFVSFFAIQFLWSFQTILTGRKGLWALHEKSGRPMVEGIPNNVMQQATAAHHRSSEEDKMKGGGAQLPDG